MNKGYTGKGKLVTRLLGRLEIFHGDGVVEFRLRSEGEINKRKVRTVVRIEGLGDIPRIENGMHIVVKSLAAQFERNDESDSAGRERSKGAA